MILLLSVFLIRCTSDEHSWDRSIATLAGTWELKQYQSDPIHTTYTSKGETYEVTQSFKAKNLNYEIIFGTDKKVHSRGSFQLLSTYKLSGKSIVRTIPISPSSLGRGLFSGIYINHDTQIIIENPEGGTRRIFDVVSATEDEIILESPLKNSPVIDLINNPISLDDQEIHGNIHLTLQRAN